MDHRDAPLTRAASPADQLAALRRHQRRLLFGGGGLITLLVLLAALFSAFSEINDFHVEQAEIFRDQRATVDAFLSYRDRLYANSSASNDRLWATRQAMLIQNGTPLAQAFRVQGEQLLIRAEGKVSVPWLVLGRETASLAPDQLAAYLGMVQEYSAYAATIITSSEFKGSVTIYGYEPKGSLFAFTGVRDEGELLRSLKVSTRDEAFALLRSQADRWDGAHPMQGSAGDGWTRFAYGVNPLDLQPSLVGASLLAVDGKPYFRRVTFEPIANLKARLAATSSGAFAIVTTKGDRVAESGSWPVAPEALLAHLRLPADAGASVRFREGGSYLLIAPLPQVDWNLVYRYGWRDLLAQTGGRLAISAGITLITLALLWVVLWRLDRRVFEPALADASRVYESEELSRIIIETSPAGLCLLDPDTGTPILENEVARAMAGDGGAADMAELYAQLAVHAKAKWPKTQQEFQWVEKGEGKRPRSLQVSMALAAYRKHPAWVCVLRDVTIQAELEEKLRRARQDSERARLAAESASRAKTAFVATMSHEIRTPLNGVLGHLELLSRSKLDLPQRERLDRIRLSADALLATISDVLDFSKIEAGQLDIDLVPFMLRPLVEQAALLYAPETQRKGVQLYYAIDPALEESYVSDVHRIRQIIHNLLSNAVKFTDSGRIVLSVAAGEASAEHALQLRFQVVDSGIGMSETQLSQLFEPFSQADASISRRYGGSGLGLALCRQLAQLLGGQIHAQSTQGVGSVFTLDIPVTPAEGEHPRTRPLAGWQITLLSAAAEWRSEIGALLKTWGASVTVISQPADLQGEAKRRLLLIIGEARSWPLEDEGRLLALHERVIRAQGNGPLIPVMREGQMVVSCYASKALLAAIQEIPLAPALPELPPQVTPGSRGAVLLVEDNPVNRELIQQQLEALGFRVDAAEDGAVALRKWRPDTYAAVLTDINMPAMNGYELAMALRERGVALPILAITATALASEKVRCNEAGIDDLLLKPLTLERLDEVLGRYAHDTVKVAPPPASTPRVNEQAAAPERRLFSEKVRRVFVENGRHDLAILIQAMEQGDRKVLIDKVHAFKGVLLMLKETQEAEECSTLEILLMEHAVDELQDDLRHLVSVLDAVLGRYERELGP